MAMPKDSPSADAIREAVRRAFQDPLPSPEEVKRSADEFLAKAKPARDISDGGGTIVIPLKQPPEAD